LLCTFININAPLKLDDDAVLVLQKFRWSGNIRQLRVAEQISVLKPIATSLLQPTILLTEGANFPSVIKQKKMKVILAMKEKFCTKCF
jgi:transcriptional regulator of acetoin/glycerol metabolism